MERLKELKKDIYRCVHCKACRFAYSGEPSRKGIGPVKGRTDNKVILYEGMLDSCPAGIEYGWEAFWNAGKMWIARAVLEGDLDLKTQGKEIEEAIFPCITCGMCEAQCENQIRTVDIIEALRAAVLEAGIPALDKHEKITELVQKLDNPYGGVKAERTKWAVDAGLEDVLDKKDKKIAYYVGCTASYRQQDTASSTVKLLRRLGYDITVLKDEVCCGSPFFRIGKVKEAQRLMNQNIELFKDFDLLLFSCAGCYRTFTIDYPKWTKKENPFKTKHAMEVVAELIKEGKIKFKPNKKLDGVVVTYHDPCHTGRHFGEYFKEKIIEESKNLMLDMRKVKKVQDEWFDIPRSIIREIPSVKFNEMYRIKMNSFCCGAGGGVKSQFPEFALKTASRRLDEAEAVKANILLTECPFCKTNLSDANKAFEHGLEVWGILELLDKYDLIEIKK
ncbi:MAG: (Fe-S)-binding protein [Promethearchaeota archaeon]